MQQSSTELDLLSTSVITPLDDHRISLLFDVPGTIAGHGHGSGHMNGGGSGNGNGSVISNGACAYDRWTGKNSGSYNTAPVSKRRKNKKPRPSEAAPSWERRTIKISMHFFYVISIGLLLCMLVYLIILNRSILISLKIPSPHQPIKFEPASETETEIESETESESGVAAALKIGTARPNSVTDALETQTVAVETEVESRSTESRSGECPSETVYSTKTGVWLYVGQVVTHGEALAFCDSFQTPSVQLIQFSESSKLENSREDLETLVETWSSSIWVNAKTISHRWYWMRSNRTIPLSKSEIDAQDVPNDTSCAVLQKRNSELRLEGNDCNRRALVICECDVDVSFGF